ncbi:serine hydrolase domain-containing protein [Arthrobacter sp. ISL-69]|uniref:serine hydrolase n=1 Tax=Arthrobacter sp. ISL-69 TaxID=2819113 RepID=UPI001BE58416|nr:serine hydrolase domain-containing protein [Arthrobacter sp. ISL-69]MBT2535653.1 beta-lactamase family protein [Arthrobacter sp. ISL-69]
MTALQADPALAARVGTVLGSRHSRFAVATVAGGSVSVAAAGFPLDADFEIGSISKGITGLLYADACARGEISADLTLGELLPLGDCKAARVTLASVSRHSSGPPRLPAAARTRCGARCRCGCAGRTRTGRTWRNCSCRRERCSFGIHVRATPTSGSNCWGRPKQPWTGQALAPAGGIRASISAMGMLARALLGGSAPGMSVLDPVADFAGPAVRIGAAWITFEAKGRSVTWHNGATGGFSSWIGLDREANTGVVLLSATSASVDRHGFRLLTELTHP